jgi:hypothetical protein
MRLQAITPQVLQRLYAELSESGRMNGEGGLSPRSVKLAHTVLPSRSAGPRCGGSSPATRPH